MPPSKAQGPPEEQTVERFLANFQLATQKTAQKLGRPLGTDRVSDARKEAMWGQSDPQVDHATILEQVRTGAVPPEQADPKNPAALAVLKASPELAPLYAGPISDPELADAAAGFATWPLRHALLRAIPDPGEQVREAERLQRAYERQHGGQTAEPPPDAAAGAAVPVGPTPPPMTSGAAVPLPVSAGAPPVGPPPDPSMIGG